MTSLRTIEALDLGQIYPNIANATKPEFAWVNPKSLLIEDAYQRQLTDKSRRLIKRIAEGFDWSKFKPPVCAKTETGDLVIIDGQHTAIAAATTGLIAEIPIMIVAALSVNDRARSFLGHNRDRVTMASYQIFASMVAAGDDTATTVQQVCDRAGVRLLRLPPAKGEFKAGDCICTHTLLDLVRRRTAVKARIVLETLVKAGAQPLRADYIEAVDAVLFDGQFGPNNPTAEVIQRVFENKLMEIEQKAEEFCIHKKIPKKRAFAIALSLYAQKRGK